MQMERQRVEDKWVKELVMRGDLFLKHEKAVVRAQTQLESLYFHHSYKLC